ncbi:MAG: hypothetical protein E7570_03225 [Ruminococcaceae bacterium]|nr:hypothetical protein [Oscillospiraceae bacterium]
MKIINGIKKLSLASAGVAAVIGILMIVFPEESLKFIALATGITFILIGIYAALCFYENKVDTFALVMGIILAVIGIVVCIYYEFVVTRIVLFFGVFILVTGLFNLFTSIKIIAQTAIFGWIDFAISLVITVLGIVAIFNLKSTANAIIILVGSALIAYAVLDVMLYLQVKKYFKEVEAEIDRQQGINPDGYIIEDSNEE